MANHDSRPHMRAEERAKQFMPFAALKGLPEALARKEKITVPPMDLSEEYREELDYAFRRIRPADMVSIVYYQDGSYVKVTGMVSKIDTDAGYIQVVNNKIRFDTIAEIIPEDEMI